ncbi:hypothetical protein [Candidatus Enterovibrio escicola]|uniref:hypothetical protein n=1 Tax=Candidatus Enterovibrio escicola TaxID=1927127 RepID=UPI001680B9F2|nr:hypothetical protein [Candidatus Enterovibrio escacola]
MCGGRKPIPQPIFLAPPAPPPVPVTDVELSGVSKKNKRQILAVKRRGAGSSQRDLKINTANKPTGLNNKGQ